MLFEMCMRLCMCIRARGLKVQLPSRPFGLWDEDRTYDRTFLS